MARETGTPGGGRGIHRIRLSEGERAEPRAPAGSGAAAPPEEAARTAARLEIHHTPGHGSWPDPAETGTGAMARQCADRRIPDRGTMCRETEAWAGRRNGEGATVDRRFTAEDARIRLGSLYPSTP